MRNLSIGLVAALALVACASVTIAGCSSDATPSDAPRAEHAESIGQRELIPIPDPSIIPRPPLPILLPIRHVTFHGNRERTGWNSQETVLTPSAVGGASFGHRWDSPAFDSVTIGGVTYPPHMFASPLYLDSVAMGGALKFTAYTADVVYAATSNGYVYAVAAFPTSSLLTDIPAGTILWKRKLTNPVKVPSLDGGVPIGVLSTPFIDMAATPPRMYVTSIDATLGWQAFALDITNGAILPGWPVDLNDSTIAPHNLNGAAHMDNALVISQRGSLNVSRDGKYLYVPFGAYYDGGIGWMVAIDTTTQTIAYAFSSDPTSRTQASGGIWSAGGAAVDSAGRVFAATGNSPVAYPTANGIWGQSLLQFSPTLSLQGTYTPFNYCAMDAKDIDLGGSSPLLFDIDASKTSTPHLAVVGSKQGSLYLLNRDAMPGGLVHRQGCSTSSWTDASLLAPYAQPQFGAKGPLNVFGPYTDDYGNLDYAKMRTAPAFFRASSGQAYVFVSGSSKASASSQTSVAPSVARIKVTSSAGNPAYLETDSKDATLAFLNPGSPVVSSNGGATPVVWVIDENAKRVQSLVDPAAPHPILHALDGMTLTPLWHSPAGELSIAGKYLTPVVAHGRVFVGTDRIQAYGLP